MKIKIAIIVLKVLFIILAFVQPIHIIITEYSRDTEIITTRTAIPIGWLIVIGLFVGVGLLLLYTWLVNSIKQNPLSFGSLAFFGLILIVILVFLGFSLNTMQELIKINAEVFVENLDKYIGTIQEIGTWVLGGMLALLLGFGLEIQT